MEADEMQEGGRRWNPKAEDEEKVLLLGLLGLVVVVWCGASFRAFL